jgi:hypothetical protein
MIMAARVEDVAAKWNISLQETFENNDYYREESGASMPYFARMARLGLCTVDSQEGKRSGRGKSLMSERASVNGFMPKDRAIHMWHSLNPPDSQLSVGVSYSWPDTVSLSQTSLLRLLARHTGSPGRVC